MVQTPHRRHTTFARGPREWTEPPGKNDLLKRPSCAVLYLNMTTTDEETPLAALPSPPRAKRLGKGGLAFIAIVAFAIGFYGVVALKATPGGTETYLRGDSKVNALVREEAHEAKEQGIITWVMNTPLFNPDKYDENGDVVS